MGSEWAQIEDAGIEGVPPGNEVLEGIAVGTAWAVLHAAVGVGIAVAATGGHVPAEPALKRVVLIVALSEPTMPSIATRWLISLPCLAVPDVVDRPTATTVLRTKLPSFSRALPKPPPWAARLPGSAGGRGH